MLSTACPGQAAWRAITAGMEHRNNADRGIARHTDAGALQSFLLCWQVLVVGLESTQSINERCPKARSGAGVHGAQLGFSVSHDRLGRDDNRLALPPKTGARQALMGHLISTSSALVPFWSWI